MNRNEEQIITAVNLKDAPGWERFYDRYYTALCSFVAGLLQQQRDDVEDLVQEVFIAVWEGDRIFTDIKELTNYLYRACYNNTLLYLRNHQLHDSILDILRQNTEEEMRAAEETAYAAAVREELIRQLYGSIRELPDEQRRMMLMRIEGHSWEEIAQRLGVSINTVKTQRSRSFRFLRQRLGKELPLLWLLLWGGAGTM